MQRDDGVQDGETLRENRFDPLEQASQVSSLKAGFFLYLLSRESDN